MKNFTDFKKKLTPLSLVAVQTIKYSNDFNKEYEYIKNLEYKHLLKNRVNTSVNEYVIQETPLKKLYDFFTESINNYTHSILQSEKKIKISESWTTRAKKGESTEPHIHTSIVNGVFYFNVPDEKTPLIFNTYNCLDERYDIPIKVSKGDLVLFPNELSHWVPENPNKENRYCLAFNTISEEAFNNSVALSNSYNKK